MNMQPVAYTAEQIDAQLAAAMAAQEERSTSRSAIVKIKTPGTYRLRILPNGDPSTFQWWASYAIHVWKKGFIGNEKGIVFNSAKHTLGQDNDPIVAALSKALADSKLMAQTNPAGASQLENMVKELSSGASFVVNAMIVPEGQMIGPIISLGLNKTSLDCMFGAARMVHPRFFMLETNYLLVVKFEPFTQGISGLKATIISREPEVNLLTIPGFDPSGIRPLSAVINDVTGNALSPALFSGDLFNPVKAQAPAAQVAYQQPAAAPAVAYAPPQAQPAVAYQPQPPAPVQYAQPVPVQQAYVLPQPQPQAIPVQSYAAPGVVAQQPGYAPPATVPVSAAQLAPQTVQYVAAPQAAQPVYAQPQQGAFAVPIAAPAAALTEGGVAELEARLLKLAS